MSVYSRPNLGLLVFEERGKPENLEPKNLSEQRREPITKSTNISGAPNEDIVQNHLT